MPTPSVDGGELIATRENAILASYAMHSGATAGRTHTEPPHPYRGPFQRDRDRITHAFAFRRLSDKTQVFTGELGDYHRTRLTHTLEVASIARSIARALRANEDLVEALALCHDIGHPPFGHAGEDVLKECLANEGGFNHNDQALRIVERLEQRYPEFPGLNLSDEVLAGQSHRAGRDAGASTSPLIEVQIVDIADSIAYNAHDADDALEIGLLSLDELLAVPLWREAHGRARRELATLCGESLRRAIVHKLIDWQVGDVIRTSQHQIEAFGIHTVDDVRRSDTIVSASDPVAEGQEELQVFLYHRVYRHADVLEKRRTAQDALRTMFDHFAADPDRLPKKFRELTASEGVARTVADYLAGMTDRFAYQAYQEGAGSQWR